jgi:hypothetical protein
LEVFAACSTGELASHRRFKISLPDRIWGIIHPKFKGKGEKNAVLLSFALTRSSQSFSQLSI